ncbi:hypothetical protein NIES3585_16130 [Nodularia sp. NIES-3585]|nr:hypothetical protein NIES3585_16130 [Nodularia sp. NIES-3585]
MELYDFYFYYYLASRMVSSNSSLVAIKKLNLPKINILVYLLPRFLVFNSEAKTLLNSISAKRKGLIQPLRISETSVYTC